MARAKMGMSRRLLIYIFKNNCYLWTGPRLWTKLYDLLYTVAIRRYSVLAAPSLA